MVALISMTFIGKGDLDNLICEKSAMDSRIINLGFRSKEYIKAELCNYDYLLLPSEEEPFGIVLLEALASGVPCIVSNAIGPSEIIKNDYNGFIFDLKYKTVSFPYVMDCAIRLPMEKRLSMKKNALDSSQKYDSKIIIERWMKLLNS